MAGTLLANILSDGTNQSLLTNLIQGSVKAWCYFNGTTGIILSSYNISSITKISTGVYQFVFINAMTDANYSSLFGCNGNGAAENVQLSNYSAGYASYPYVRTSTTFQVACGALNSNAFVDTPSNSVVIVR